MPLYTAPGNHQFWRVSYKYHKVPWVLLLGERWNINDCKNECVVSLVFLRFHSEYSFLFIYWYMFIVVWATMYSRLGLFSHPNIMLVLVCHCSLAEKSLLHLDLHVLNMKTVCAHQCRIISTSVVFQLGQLATMSCMFLEPNTCLGIFHMPIF